MQLLISKCSQANGKWIDQFIRNWGMGHWGGFPYLYPYGDIASKSVSLMRSKWRHWALGAEWKDLVQLLPLLCCLFPHCPLFPSKI